MDVSIKLSQQRAHQTNDIMELVTRNPHNRSEEEPAQEPPQRDRARGRGRVRGRVRGNGGTTRRGTAPVDVRQDL